MADSSKQTASKSSEAKPETSVSDVRPAEAKLSGSTRPSGSGEAEYYSLRSTTVIKSEGARPKVVGATTAATTVTTPRDESTAAAAASASSDTVSTVTASPTCDTVQVNRMNRGRSLYMFRMLR